MAHKEGNRAGWEDSKGARRGRAPIWSHGWASTDGGPRKHMYNFMSGCVHYFSGVKPISGFLQSLKEKMTFHKGQEP